MVPRHIERWPLIISFTDFLNSPPMSKGPSQLPKPWRKAASRHWTGWSVECASLRKGEDSGNVQAVLSWASCSARRAMIVDLALSVTGSQLIASVLPMVGSIATSRWNVSYARRLQVDKDQRALLYECIRGHIVTLRGCKTGSKVIWLL